MQKYKLLIGVSMLWVIGSVFAFSNIPGDYNYKSDWTIEFIKQDVVSLTTESDKQEVESKIDLSESNIALPTDCLKDNIFCEEETEIIIVTKKSRRPIRYDSILTEDLHYSDLAKYFPDIKDDLVNDYSNQDDRLVTQRILYTLWYLPVLPTGKIWYQTELATMKFQCLKWIKEYDSTNTMFYIGPETVEELNALKSRMQDPNYFDDKIIPEVNLAECGDEFADREKMIDYLMDHTTKKYQEQTIDTDSSKLKAEENLIKLDGEVIIKKSILE